MLIELEFGMRLCFRFLAFFVVAVMLLMVPDRSGAFVTAKSNLNKCIAKVKKTVFRQETFKVIDRQPTMFLPSQHRSISSFSFTALGMKGNKIKSEAECLHGPKGEIFSYSTRLVVEGSDDHPSDEFLYTFSNMHHSDTIQKRLEQEEEPDEHY